MFGVNFNMAAVCAMLEPIMPAAPTMVNFSLVKNAITAVVFFIYNIISLVAKVIKKEESIVIPSSLMCYLF